MRRAAGFTLIELLVVIAIIAILAAILFPVFAKARDKARTIACLNNVKQIALACHMYIGDWDGFFPWGTSSDMDWHVDRWDPDPPNLLSGLLPYVENNYALFRCPVATWTRLNWTGGHLDTYAMPYHWGGMGVFGGHRPGGDREGDPFAAANITDLIQPANTVITYEFQNCYAVSGYADFTVEHPAAYSGAYVGFYHADTTGTFWEQRNFWPHAGHTLANYAFADGHAKGLKSNMQCTEWDSSGQWCYTLADMYTWWADEPMP